MLCYAVIILTFNEFQDKQISDHFVKHFQTFISHENTRIGGGVLERLDRCWAVIEITHWKMCLKPVMFVRILNMIIILRTAGKVIQEDKKPNM